MDSVINFPEVEYFWSPVKRRQWWRWPSLNRIWYVSIVIKEVSVVPSAKPISKRWPILLSTLKRTLISLFSVKCSRGSYEKIFWNLKNFFFTKFIKHIMNPVKKCVTNHSKVKSSWLYIGVLRITRKLWKNVSRLIWKRRKSTRVLI